MHDGLVPALHKSFVPVHKALRRKHATKIEDGGSNPSRGAKVLPVSTEGHDRFRERSELLREFPSTGTSILQEGHYPTRRSVAQ